MFTSQIYWRVKALVSTLSRQNFEEHRTEMSDLTRTHGENVKIFYLASLLDEADFVNPQAIRDEIKVTQLFNFLELFTIFLIFFSSSSFAFCETRLFIAIAFPTSHLFYVNQ